MLEFLHRNLCGIVYCAIHAARQAGQNIHRKMRPRFGICDLKMSKVKQLNLFTGEPEEAEPEYKDKFDYLDWTKIKPRISRGEIYQLGKHRVMCGDATSESDILKLIDGAKIDLVLTDPPYGMKAQHRTGKCTGRVGNERPRNIGMQIRGKPGALALEARVYPIMAGDDNPETAKANYEIVKKLCKLQIIWGGQYLAHFLPISGGWIVWDKLNIGCDFSDCELAWKSKGLAVKRYQHKWNGIIRGGSQELNLKRRVHPTQKPVELLANIINDFCPQGGMILDCFGGSGSALIAAEITGRRCCMMELSEIYCELILRRYELLTGQAAKAIE